MSPTRPRILVINPNSNRAVTQGLDEAMDPFRFANGPEIVCTGLAQGPAGIETQKDVESVVLPLRELVSNAPSFQAFIIACYSDPGLYVCREAATCPVFGINECGVLTALSRGDRFGVIAMKQVSIRRHLRYLRQMGLSDRLANERALDVSVAETAEADTLEKMIAVGKQLRDEDGADSVVMGCAGMSRHRLSLEAELGIPVIDPAQAAAAMAIGAVMVSRRFAGRS
jgi:allantoin racemase